MRSRDNVIQQTSAFKEKTYAESFTVVGSIKDIKCYQDQVNSIAPFFGHYPKAPKSHSKNEILTNSKCCYRKYQSYFNFKRYATSWSRNWKSSF